MPSRKNQVTYSQHPNRAAHRAHARGDGAFRSYDTSFVAPKRSKAPAVIAAIVAVVIIAVAAWAALTLFGGCSSDRELVPAGQEVSVTIPEGSGASAIAEDLADAGLISDPGAFKKRVNERQADTQLKPGTYAFVGGATADELIDGLIAGPGLGNAVTIPEGSKLSDIAAAVATASDGRISADAFTQAAADASAYAAEFPFLESAGANSLEGFLFPKTYEVADDATADSLIRTMLAQFQTETASLDWSYPQSQGLTVYQAVNLASIVEKESSGDEQIRAQVASVFYNRLATSGEPTYGFLQSDATTAYEVGHDPSADEVHADTPYSTYTHQGLPPTPICSPSLDCLQAVCAPDQGALGKYFYFYFEGDNYTFSETYDDHMSSFS